MLTNECMLGLKDKPHKLRQNWHRFKLNSIIEFLKYLLGEY